MINKDKFPQIVSAAVFVFGILIGIAALYIFYIKTNDSLIDYFTRTLRSIGEARAEQVKLFLDGKKNRAVDFSSDGFIKNSLYNIKHDIDKEETVEKLNYHLTVNKLPVDKDFYKVLALGINGAVVASTDNGSIKLDLAADPIFLEGRHRPYVKSLIYDNVSNVKSFVLSAPVVRENEFVGVIVIKMLPNVLTEIMSRKNEFSDKLETYLINENGYLITPSRFLEGENKGILTQIVDSKNAKKCLEDLKKEKHEFKDDSVMFVDFRGEDVVGSHSIIPEINWCLLAEVDYSVLWEGKKEGFKIAIFLLLIGAGLSSFVIFLLSKKYFE